MTSEREWENYDYATRAYLGPIGPVTAAFFAVWPMWVHWLSLIAATTAGALVSEWWL